MPNTELFSISAAAAKIGACTDTLRRYSDEGIVSPVRDSSGRRLFSMADIERARAHRAHTAARGGRK